jgi:hypothetical protein
MRPYIPALALALCLPAGVAGAATGPASASPSVMPAPAVPADIRAAPVALSVPGSVFERGSTGAPVIDVRRDHGRGPPGWWIRAWAWAKGHHGRGGGGPAHAAPLALAGGLPALLLFGGAVGLALRARRS